MKKEIRKVYCGKCGRECLLEQQSASLWRCSYPHLEGYSETFPKFNTQTGEENLVNVWKCPNRVYQKKNFWGNEVTRYDESHLLKVEKANF
jgi:hypothetical protein